MRPRIGIIGAGVMGTTHGKAIHFCFKSGLIDGEFVGIADEDDGAARRVRGGIAARTLVTAERRRADRTRRRSTRSTSARRRSTTSNWRRRSLARGKALFCEKPLAFNGRRRRDHARRGEGCRRHAPGRAGDALLAGDRRDARPDPRAGVGPADDVRDGRRPVLPDPGALRQHVARRRDEGRRGHAAGARDPRHRHPHLVLRPREARVRRHAPLLREGGRRGPEQRDAGVRERRRRQPRLDLAQPAAPRLQPAHERRLRERAVQLGGRRLRRRRSAARRTRPAAARTSRRRK